MGPGRAGRPAADGGSGRDAVNIAVPNAQADLRLAGGLTLLIAPLVFWLARCSEPAVHHVQADVADFGVVEGLGNGADDLEAEGAPQP